MSSIRPSTIVKYAAFLEALEIAAATSTTVIKLHDFTKEHQVTSRLIKPLFKIGVIRPSNSACGFDYEEKRDYIQIAREVAHETAKLADKARSTQKEVKEKVQPVTEPAERIELSLSRMEARMLGILLEENGNRYLNEFSTSIGNRLKLAS